MNGMKRLWNYLRSRPLYGGLIVLGLISLSIILWPSPKLSLTVVSQKPTEGETKFSVYESPTFTFNQEVFAEDFSVNSIPEENWQITQLSPDTIALTHKLYLQVNHDYQLTLTHRSGFSTATHFTTKAEQNDPRYLQGVQADMDRDYPLATSFPYETNLLSAIYSAPLTIQITIKSPYLTSSQAIAQMKSYISGKGGDASVHKYIVIPASPLPSPSTAPLTTQPDL